MNHREGIACDFCEKPLESFPVLVAGLGWSYVWSDLEIGTASFSYATCSECCDKEHSKFDNIEACLKRAARHGKGWRQAVDRFVVRTLAV